MIRAAILLLAGTLPAVAQSPSVGVAARETQELVALCRGAIRDEQGSRKNVTDAIQCLSYIQGFKDGLVFTGGAPRFCIAAKVSFGEQVQAFIRWADQHRDALTQSKQATLIKFFEETYRCPK
jgi:hypothetical protein